MGEDVNLTWGVQQKKKKFFQYPYYCLKTSLFIYYLLNKRYEI